jgi:hypothetical protein
MYLYAITMTNATAMSKIDKIHINSERKNLLHVPVDKFSQTITEGSGACFIVGQTPSIYL